jgi:hypothetical protein
MVGVVAVDNSAMEAANFWAIEDDVAGGMATDQPFEVVVGGELVFLKLLGFKVDGFELEHGGCCEKGFGIKL